MDNSSAVGENGNKMVNIDSITDEEELHKLVNYTQISNLAWL